MMVRQKGSILITGLWAMSFFSIMTTSLTFNAAQQTLLMKRQLESFQSKTDFISILNQVASLIQSDPFTHEDSTQDAWFGTITLAASYKDRLTAQVEDEESKINLNQVEGGLLSIFFKLFEEDVKPLKGSRKDYVKGILKLRAVKRIESLEELLLMEGFDQEDLEILKPYITVYPELPLINLNTAKPLILKALVTFLSGDSLTREVFMARLGERCQTEPKISCVLTTNDLRPEIFSEKLKLPKNPVMLMLAQEFLSKVTTDSETFHIVIESRQNHSASAIFRYRVGQPRPQIFWWHEE